mgnify:CR=1 FL=1
MKHWLMAFVLMGLASFAWGVEPDEVLVDPVLEERARDLSKQLRCVVCLNQDIDSSNAGVARTMRIVLRERLVAGDSDPEVLNFFVERYSDFVLFRPPLKGSTYLLWFGPLIIFGLGAGIVAVVVRRTRAPHAMAQSLTADEERQIEALMEEKGSD